MRTQLSSLVRRLALLAIALAAGLLLSRTTPALASQADQLALDVYTADSNAFGVTSTLIYGKSEAILVDAQFRISDARKLADRIAATGRHLKAIIITHPHPDHYFGIATLLERFPGTPVHISAAGLRDFSQRVASKIAQWTPVYGAEVPTQVPTPQPLPRPTFMLDGEAVEVIADLQGDELAPSNSLVWVPPLRAEIAGDLVYDQVHVWLAESNAQTRQAWLGSLRRLAALKPLIVVAGHTKRGDSPNGPDAVDFTARYIADFDAAKAASRNADELVAAMKQKYRDAGLDGILAFAAKAAFAN